MTSEIRANTLKNRVGLGTVSFTNTGPVVSGIVTIANSTAEGVRLEDNAGVGGSLKITTPTGYVSIGAGNATFAHLQTDRGIFYFNRRITVDEGIISSYDENLILQSPVNTTRLTINKDTGLVSIVNDLDVDGHTNLDNVSIAGVVTATTFVGALTGTASGNATISSNASNRIITGGSGNALTGNSDLLWNGSRLDIDTGGTEDALRIGNTAGTDTFIRLGSISTSADTHAVLKYDKDDNYVSLLVSGESHGNGGILIANGGAVSLSAGTSPLAKLHVKDDIYVKGSSGDGSTGIQIRSGSSALSNQHQVRTGGGTGNMLILEAVGSSGIFQVQTGNGGERFRINANGDVTTTGQASFDRQNAGFTARSGDSVSITRASGTPLEINRTGSDGQMIGLLDDNSYEAAIGLSGGSLVFGLPNTSTPRLTITSGGHATINSNSYEALNINTNDNGVNGPEISLFHNSASPAVNDVVGQLRYTGRDSATNITLYSKIETKVDNVTNGSETGFLDFSTRGGGAYNSIFRLKNRSTASAPSYTADDMNGIILDVYNTGNPYPRYMNFIAKAAGNTDSNIAFWTETIGGSPLERLRIDSKGSMRHMGTSGYWQITVIHNGSGSGNWYSGSAPQRIYPNYIDNRTGYAEFYLTFHPSVSYSGWEEPTFVICGESYLSTGGQIDLNYNGRTNSPNNGSFRCYHGEYSWQIYNDGDGDVISGMRTISRNVEHHDGSYTGSSTQSIDYIHSYDGRYGTNAEPIVDQRSYIKIKMNKKSGTTHYPIQGHTVFVKFTTYTQGDKTWQAYMYYN